MDKLRAFLFCGAAIFLSACTTHLVPLVSFARFSSPIKEPVALTNHEAIIYGRFARSPDFGFGNKVAVRLRNEDLHTDYLLECLTTNNVYGVAVKPGKYRVAGFVATFLEYRVAGSRDLKNSPVFDVPTNAIVYVGDVDGFAKVQGLSEAWGIQAITNNFTETTDEFRRNYHSLDAIHAASAFDQLASKR